SSANRPPACGNRRHSLKFLEDSPSASSSSRSIIGTLSAHPLCAFRPLSKVSWRSASSPEVAAMIDWRRFARKLGVALNLREPPNVPPYGWSYFDHLVSLYVTLNTSDGRAD